MGFSRQEYWSGLPLHSPGDLPHLEIKPTSLASPALAGGFLPLNQLGTKYKFKIDLYVIYTKSITQLYICVCACVCVYIYERESEV